MLTYLFIIAYNTSERMCDRMNVMSAIQNTIPISHFNRGLAGQIFAEVRNIGAKVVMKNNSPECVLLSPEEYVRLMNELNEAKLIAIAAQRMATFDSSKAIPASDVYKELGITEEDLSGFDEVEFE